MQFCLLLLAIALSIFLGGCWSARRWARNARAAPGYRMKYRGKFYRVTLPDEEDF